MNTLNDARVSAVIERLHAAAANDGDRWSRRRAAQKAGELPQDDGLVRMGEFYLAVSPEEGRLLYLLARSRRARTLVEFGASFGVSTLYLAAAARDLDARLLTTEVHPDKCRALRANLAEAGLDDGVEVLEGDALQTLAAIDGPIDLLLLDGWKSLYRPLFEMLRPRLSDGALVVADNVDHEAAADYVRCIGEDPAFLTHTLGDAAISCHVG